MKKCPKQIFKFFSLINSLTLLRPFGKNKILEKLPKLTNFKGLEVMIFKKNPNTSSEKDKILFLLQCYV